MKTIHHLYKLKMAFETHGKDCVFSRAIENEFHELQGENETIKIRGLFHEASGYLNVSTTEAGKIYTRKEPKLLILFQKNVSKGDYVVFDGLKYQITGIDDLGNMHLCLDLSMEAVE